MTPAKPGEVRNFSFWPRAFFLRKIKRFLASWTLALLLATGITQDATAQNPPPPLDPSLALNPLPLITTGRELIELSAQECSRHYPVRVRGTITYFDRSR